jgi:hypothetical protein
MPKPATNAKTVGYTACMAGVVGIFVEGDRWNDIIFAVFGFAFFYMGVFQVFASDATMIDFWGPKSRLGRAFSDPATGKQALLTSRFIGIGFIIMVLYVAFKVFQFPFTIDATRR